MLGWQDFRHWRVMLTAQSVVPAFVLMVLVMMLLPLPAWLLDALFTFNIGFSVMVLMATLGVSHFKDFVSFPALLLLTTLLRLSLNVASTRAILLHGHSGSAAAGHVIESFGHFLIGNNFWVGLVIFAVITIINFVVITKGAGRVAEVSARFALDSMPGKQMAIDADLNAGLIRQEEARTRRLEVAQEADFYGSMDGASKFVRGDAVAGIMILFINLVGGVIVGVWQHGMGLGAALDLYGALTIGDGLVAQVPALVVSTAAGILVTRVATEDNFSMQLAKQLGRNDAAMFVAAGVLVALGLLPGMPHLAFVALGTLFAGLAWLTRQRRIQATATPQVNPTAPSAQEDLEWSDVPVVDALSLELSYKLVPMVERGASSELVQRVRAARRQFMNEVGFLPPVIHVRDNLTLPSQTYRITLYGSEIGRGTCWPQLLLAIAPTPSEVLPGIATTEPSFGLAASWIEPSQKMQAIVQDHTVVEPAVVVVTHLDTLLRRHAHELLGHQETQALLDNLRQVYPRLVEDLVPKQVPVASLQKVLQALVEEGVPIVDLRGILQACADTSVRSSSPLQMLVAARLALRRILVERIFEPAGVLQVIGLHPEFERLMVQALGEAEVAEDGTFEPALMRALVKDIADKVDAQENAQLPPVIVCAPALRLTLARLARQVRSQCHVLSLRELPPQRQIQLAQVLGRPGSAQPSPDGGSSASAPATAPAPGPAP